METLGYWGFLVHTCMWSLVLFYYAHKFAPRLLSAMAIEEAQHLKKLIQDYIAFFIKVGDKEYRSTLPLESRDRSFTQEENENLWKQSAGEPIRGLVYDYPEKTYQKKKAWYCGSSS